MIERCEDCGGTNLMLMESEDMMVRECDDCGDIVAAPQPLRFIQYFDGTAFDFLSNFHPSPVRWNGLTVDTVEHAYQAAKSPYPDSRGKLIATASSPGLAKRMGQRCELRPDWEEIKVEVMLDLLRQKFAGGELAWRLMATGDAQLIEGNQWGDRYWGMVNGEGENWLGRCLMTVREELQR